MGDFKKTRQPQDVAEEREERIRPGSGTLKKLSRLESEYKTQVITAKVYPEIWTAFKRINRTRGMSNNSVINMLITGYIRENQNLLYDDKSY